MQQFIKDHLQSAEIFKAETKKLADTASIVDKEISNLYHMLEILNLDAVHIAKISKKLSAALKVRRELKEDLNVCNLILHTSPAKLLPLEEFEKRGEQRAKRYKEEAQIHFDKMFKNSKVSV